jgi:hypothetical protein
MDGGGGANIQTEGCGVSIKNESIVDRVVERLKKQPLGDLITEEDLHDIVKQAIPKTFFEPRIVKDTSGSYYAKDKEQPPLIVEVLGDVLRGSVRAAVDEWVQANQETMAAQLKQIVDVGVAKYVHEMEAAAATEGVRKALAGWTDQINKQREQQGLPQMPIFFA